MSLSSEIYHEALEVVAELERDAAGVATVNSDCYQRLDEFCDILSEFLETHEGEFLSVDRPLNADELWLVFSCRFDEIIISNRTPDVFYTLINAFDTFDFEYGGEDVLIFRLQLGIME